MRKSHKNIIGIAISVGLVVLLIYKIDLNSVKSEIIDFNFNILFALAVIYIIGFALRSYRWQLLIKSREDVPIIPVFKSLAIGYMINNLLPAKVGELARMEYLKRKLGTGRSFLLGTIFIERLLDVLMVMIFLLVSLFLSETIRSIIAEKTWLFVLIVLFILISFYLLISKRGTGWLTRLIPAKFRVKFEQMMLSFKTSGNFMKDRRLLQGVGLLSFIIWVLTLAASIAILYGLDTILPFYAYLFVIAAGVFGLVIPSTSGGIGVYHAIATGALLLFGVPPPVAMSYAIIAHAFDFIPAILTGGAVVLYDGVKSNKHNI